MPVLLADCEGLEGGNLEPSALRILKQFKKTTNLPGRLKHQFKPSTWVDNQQSRPVGWAITESQKTREHVVKELYPRLLYTFSDVVVFAAKDAK